MERNLPKWEQKLWSYVSSGDGMHCPFYQRCPLRRRGIECADESREKLAELFYHGDDFNPVEYSCISWLHDRSWGLFKLVEKLANRLLKKLRIHRFPVSENVVYRLGAGQAVEIRYIPMKACHGALWHRDGRWIIQVNKNDDLKTQRFTIFHEAFHILAHCRTQPVFRKMGLMRGSYNELLADFFAVCMLMPKEQVKQQWQQVKDLNAMADLFKVPKSAMWYQLKENDLIRPGEIY
jgi:Zn-dependent peptidase ImmA (M78 family)